MKNYPTIYVFVQLNTAHLRVEKVLLMTDEQPSVTVPLRYAYALLFKVQGRTVEAARRQAIKQLEESPFYRWAHDILET